MSIKDFDACTPSEFKAIADSWKQCYESQERVMWERMRYQCLCILQPHSKNHLRPIDILQFPWEETHNTTSHKTHEISNEEIKKRNAEAKRRYGLK